VVIRTFIILYHDIKMDLRNRKATKKLSTYDINLISSSDVAFVYMSFLAYESEGSACTPIILLQLESSPVWLCHDNKRVLFIDADFQTQLKLCYQSKSRLIIIPLTLSYKDGCLSEKQTYGTHANLLIYDKKFKILERFEPNGNVNTRWYDGDELDQSIRDKFGKLLLIKDYYPPAVACPVAFQKIEAIEPTITGIDPIGYCNIWVLWYADLRISNLDVKRYTLLQYALSNIATIGFRDFIRDYAHFVIEIYQEHAIK
jgi:hypothetical protein